MPSLLRLVTAVAIAFAAPTGALGLPGSLPSHHKPLGVLVPTSTSTTYDGDGRVKTVSQVKAVWRTFFDVDSSVTEVTTSEHDGLGRLWREHRYDGKVVEYAYDLKGNRKKVTDPDGVETSYDFDAANRLTTVTTMHTANTFTGRRMPRCSSQSRNSRPKSGVRFSHRSSRGDEREKQ